MITNETVEVENKRRSERVILRIAVVASVGMYDRDIVSGPTFTQVVNVHGGLLSLRMGLFAEQTLLLNNLKTGMARHCSVIGAEKSATSEFLVAFQYKTRAADFWAITFPPKDWQAP